MVQRDGVVRIVEVKAREADEDALEAVTPSKQARLRRGGEAWLQNHPAQVEIAFAVALVTLQDGIWGLEILDDAF